MLLSNEDSGRFRIWRSPLVQLFNQNTGLMDINSKGNAAGETHSPSEIIYDGSKTYWKTRIRVDILIAIHDLPGSETIEIISFHHLLLTEGNRIYLSLTRLMSKFDKLLQSRIDASIENLFLQGKAIKLSVIAKQQRNELIVEYILARLEANSRLLFITSKCRLGTFSVYLAPHFNDVVSDSNPAILDCVIDQPQHLRPLQHTFQKSAMCVSHWDISFGTKLENDIIFVGYLASLIRRYINSRRRPSQFATKARWPQWLWTRTKMLPTRSAKGSCRNWKPSKSVNGLGKYCRTGLDRFIKWSTKRLQLRFLQWVFVLFNRIVCEWNQ